MKNNEVNRAAQFLPFDALKGLNEEIQSRIEKRSRISRKELSEEMRDEISCILSKLQVNSRIKVNFYLNGHYYDIEGDVTKVDSIYHYLLMGKQKIFFEDIYEISIID